MPYSESYFIARESWRDWRTEAQLLMKLARANQDSRVLEIGCGGGGLLRLLRRCGAHAVGVDTSSTALSLARVRTGTLSAAPSRGALEGVAQNASPHFALDETTNYKPLLVQIGEDARLPFADATFDGIIAQHVVEHLPDSIGALSEWRRLLSHNGRIALATPNVLYPDPQHFADAEHTHVFNPRELRETVERAGYQVESCGTIFPFLTRVRVLRAFGVVAYRLFRRIPYFSARGRTILLSAQRL